MPERTLAEADVAADPIVQFQRWFDEAVAARLAQPEAMTLATAHGGQPAARMVLLKSVDARGFVFFTNYESDKGRALDENPRAALLFFWEPLERQVRVEGPLSRVSGEESDAYFASRPLGSRIGAWASPQSRVIPDRAFLDDKVAEIAARHPDGQVPRPPHWGGFRLAPERIEFWQGRPSRLHDRLRYRLADGGRWVIERLAP